MWTFGIAKKIWQQYDLHVESLAAGRGPSVTRRVRSVPAVVGGGRQEQLPETREVVDLLWKTLYMEVLCLRSFGADRRDY